MTRPALSTVAVAATTIGFAIAFNIPFSLLAASFEYPDVLRRPAGEVLQMFHSGGAPLILTWHAFALAALFFVPLSLLLGLRKERLAQSPGLGIAVAVTGSLAGLAQAIGLWRWVFVVPGLAATYVDPASTEAMRLGATQSFELIHQYGGVAIGEHIGQLLTAMFALLLALAQWREKSRIVATLGFAAAAAIAIGTNEGVLIALGQSGEAFAKLTVFGFMGLSAWLIATGIAMLFPRRAPRVAKAQLAAA